MSHKSSAYGNSNHDTLIFIARRDKFLYSFIRSVEHQMDYFFILLDVILRVTSSVYISRIPSIYLIFKIGLKKLFSSPRSPPPSHLIMPVHIKVILHSHENFTNLTFLESAEGYENHLIYFPDGGIIKWSTSAQLFPRRNKIIQFTFFIPISIPSSTYIFCTRRQQQYATAAAMMMLTRIYVSASLI